MENLEIADLPKSSRRNPFVGFNMKRSLGRDVLEVSGISKTIDGEKVLDNVSFTVNDGDKIVFLGENDVAKTTLLKILNGDVEPDSGTFKWGITTTHC
ncbi:MAG: ATP-binding cassette domain-containing protein [Bdellovibrionales bacterium]